MSLELLCYFATLVYQLVPESSMLSTFLINGDSSDFHVIHVGVEADWMLQVAIWTSGGFFSVPTMFTCVIKLPQVSYSVKWRGDSYPIAAEGRIGYTNIQLWLTLPFFLNCNYMRNHNVPK